MNVLLDTNVLIDVLRGKQDVLAALGKLVSEGHTLATAAINIGEVYAGMLPHEEARTERFLGSLDCYVMTATIGKHAGKLKNEQARQGKTLSLADMIVAATTLQHGAVLMTANRKDFPIDALQFREL